jgi:hypothetical protein
VMSYRAEHFGSQAAFGRLFHIQTLLK